MAVVRNQNQSSQTAPTAEPIEASPVLIDQPRGDRFDVALMLLDEIREARNRYHHVRPFRDQDPKGFTDAETAYRQTVQRALAFVNDSAA